LLGTPQGLSVYSDGLRVDQPFRDVVSWDLIPRIAMSTMTMMPGSDPVFGLNTLGGALVLQTKNGVNAAAHLHRLRMAATHAERSSSSTADREQMA
jgi:hypothetical protein